MIFFLYGPDTYRSRHKLKELTDKFIKEVDQSELNLSYSDGAKIKVEELNSAVATPPFLARKRMVVVTDLLSKNKDKELGRQVIELLEKETMLKDVVLIFWESAKVDERTVLFKRLAKEKYAQKFDLFNEFEVKSWIRLEIKHRGGNIASAGIDRLSQLAGNDLWQLNSEVDKLIAYKNSKTIEEADVVVLVKGRFDDNIFDFVDAIANKNQKLAMHLLSDQLNSGANELYLLTMLIRQFRILLQVKDLTADSLASQQQVAVELGLHPFVARKALQQVRNFSADKLKSIYRELLATDVKIKTSYAAPETLFGLLLVKIMN